jgi:hypothetical protein
VPALNVDTSRLAPLPGRLHLRLTALLDALAPPLIDAEMTKATARDDGVEIVLAHATTIPFTIWIQAERDTILVGCSALHEETSDPAAALATVAQLLCGLRDVPNYDGTTLRPDFGARPAPA